MSQSMGIYPINKIDIIFRTINYYDKRQAIAEDFFSIEPLRPIVKFTMETRDDTLIEIYGSEANFQVTNLDVAADDDGTQSILGFVADPSGVASLKASGTISLDATGSNLSVDLAELNTTDRGSLTLIEAAKVNGTFAGEFVSCGREQLAEASNLTALEQGEYFLEYTTNGEVVLHYHPSDPDSVLTVTNVGYTGSGIPIGNQMGGAVQGTALVDGAFGTLEMDQYGNYSYHIDEIATNSLGDSEVVKDAFTYEISDGTNTTLNVTVTGSDNIDQHDAPVVIHAAYSGQGKVNGPHSSGMVHEATLVSGQYGTLCIYPDGAYSYEINHEIAARLDPGVTVLDDFSYIYRPSRFHSSSERANLRFTIQGEAEDLDTDLIQVPKFVEVPKANASSVRDLISPMINRCFPRIMGLRG